MDHCNVTLAGGPLHNQLRAFSLPLCVCIVIEDSNFNVDQTTQHIYCLEYFNGRPVYLYTRLVPKNITNN